MVNYANDNHPATKDQINLILRLARCDSLDQIENIPNCPWKCQNLTLLEKTGFLDSHRAGQMIEALIPWNNTH
ncbi:hypothetical protein [Bifidobacterium callitrichidarum]|uniref:Uncharacterized protein n=1 Tax=Bifidobacterium callitrichidarum TaxID=2052941 RepID=A0A2U2N0R9_9BIFI|nr:hypothetical protein [Bifidobacterium callitrichidarum]PWG62662.1 hypothetical protein DF196_11935 [Bifidobacterium callitrichidarum]